MADNLILTAVGPDRVGLVEKISEFIVQRGCNIEDSKMAVFCGEFALILLLSGDSNDLPKVTDAYEALARETGLHIWIKTPAGKRIPEPSLPYSLVASSMDHPGIVYRISSVLSGLGVNIDSMETKTYAAPESGTPVFRLDALVSIPAKLNVNGLRARFAEIQREENIDIELALAERGKRGMD
jgi:glycine cleavage system transcriptional repressor